MISFISHVSNHFLILFSIVFLLKEANEVVDVQNIEHILQNKESLSEIVEKIDENWNNQREVFYQRTGLNQQTAEEEQPRLLQLQENEQENNAADEFFQLLYQNE